MKESDLKDIQQALNFIRSQAEEANSEAKVWQAPSIVDTC